MEPEPAGNCEQAHAILIPDRGWLVRMAGAHRHGVAARVEPGRVLEGAFQDTGQLRPVMIVAGQVRAGTNAEKVQGLVRVGEKLGVTHAGRHGPDAAREESRQGDGWRRRLVETREHGVQGAGSERRGRPVRQERTAKRRVLD